MTKKELINKVYRTLKIYAHKDIAYAVNIVFDSMTVALKRGERIEVRGFGNFTVKERKAQSGRNPKSGMLINLGKRKKPFFKTGKELRLMVNSKK